MKQICHWLCLLLVVASCTADKSAEMEKVIAYYRDSVPDEEKLYAALFLRDNMDVHYSMESEAAKVFRREVDSLFTYDGKMARYDDQRRIAQQIMDKEVKVSSQRITDIKDEMRYILEETDFK